MTTPSLTRRLGDVQPRMLGMRGEGDPKRLGTPDDRRDLGRALEHAMDAARLTKQELSYRMGYADQGQISKWTAGAESPHFWRLWAVVPLRADLVVSLARLSGPAVDVRTVITVGRERVA